MGRSYLRGAKPGDQDRRARDGGQGQGPDTEAREASSVAAEEPAAAESLLPRYRVWGMPRLAVVDRRGDVFIALPQEMRTFFIAELLQLRANFISETFGPKCDGGRFVLKPTATMTCYNRGWSLFERRPEIADKLSNYQLSRGSSQGLSKARRQWWESFQRQTFGGQLWAKILLSAGTVTAHHVEAVNEWARAMIERREGREPDEDWHLINEQVLPRATARPGQTRPKVSRQLPQQQKLSLATDYWGGDRNKDTGEARTVLHFAMQRYLEQQTPRLGQY